MPAVTATEDPAPARRTSGRPPSGNGASSFHLFWPSPPPCHGAVHSVSATLEILTPPTSPDVYFWALQASFIDSLTPLSPAPPAAAAHLGLQYNPSCTNSRGANWGGYDGDGAILAGTPLASPRPLPCGNTGDFAWEACRSYTLEIGPRRADGWPGAVTDCATGVRTELRRLAAAGDALGAVMVWSEVFADCGAPAVAARWSRLRWRFVDGSAMDVPNVTVAYQKWEDGGCCNTESTVDEVGVVQRTAVAERRVRQGATLTMPRGRGDADGAVGVTDDEKAT
jgi:hypothetical protein